MVMRIIKFIYRKGLEWDTKHSKHYMLIIIIITQGALWGTGSQLMR